MDDTEVLVIGAGLAGLRCAARAAQCRAATSASGRRSDAIGGRVRTDVIDGFRCDRGFQVLNPAYPELKRATDVAALRLQPFGAGVAVRREPMLGGVGAPPAFADARCPRCWLAGASGPRTSSRSRRWAAGALRPGRLKSKGHADTSLRSALDRAGVSGELRRVIDRFLAGVLLDDAGVTSNAFALLLIRMFVLGVPALPAEGMQALPRQLAAGLGDQITLQRNVTELTRSRLRLAGVATARTSSVRGTSSSRPIR